ncbi:hypothetical protein UCRPA7_2675 [Phaeoacremonium minimum UCRPA7]|uniref:Uncharacterized protein n=1 Tax=Phaeoacremonium minimum (strain UCR-PA7) TaxID=1286976 RepID=R8BR67_PHAM7|nr:hypothetical protein UCRPA7_2675 [Phaeoacremonium minimum UCRPA7]EOO01858.1 hypothetical protein UCRPA7_2675 [Phaeoacremonium minimum UCRPA7]
MASQRKTLNDITNSYSLPSESRQQKQKQQQKQQTTTTKGGNVASSTQKSATAVSKSRAPAAAAPDCPLNTAEKPVGVIINHLKNDDSIIKNVDKGQEESDGQNEKVPSVPCTSSSSNGTEHISPTHPIRKLEVDGIPESDPTEISQLWASVSHFVRNQRRNTMVVRSSYASTTEDERPRLVINPHSRAPVPTTITIHTSLDATAGATPPPFQHHHIHDRDVVGFATAASRAHLPGLATLPELTDSAQYHLFRNAPEPADQKPDAEGGLLAAQRILHAKPNDQDEVDSLWHRAPAYFLCHNDGSKTLTDTTAEAAAAHISFWLLVANSSLSASAEFDIVNRTGTYYQRSVAPYLSVQYCDRARCFHRDPKRCNALHALSDIANTSLYNRYLLREEAAYRDAAFRIETGDIAHYAAVMN